MNDEQELDLKTLKYVMYLRKSTEGAERQVRSISDQERDCRELAQRLGLNVIAVIKEEKSAKEPNKRPLFLDMIKRIRAKEFNAVIAWHWLLWSKLGLPYKPNDSKQIMQAMN